MNTIYTYALRHRGDKYKFTMGPAFSSKERAMNAAHNLKRSKEYSEVIVLSTKREWQRGLGEPVHAAHSSHKPKAPAHKN